MSCSHASGLSPQLSSLWRTAFITCVWVIWSTRNRLLFSNYSPLINSAAAFIWASLKEANSFNIGAMHNSIDDLLRLRAFSISGCPNQNQIRLRLSYRLLGNLLLRAG
ncbi:hypothetical protein Salmi_Mp056 (mitochondrion) [Salvia miltiorrhiza]|uniref:Uncharacterized protein n=1 Tax=Salvia miltiorrhiza TaxID=226208 RepID=V9P4R8_SALMI|nr:hypothetical protein Salmi_Mp056 [Salvia miltiorrhiza]AGU16585.1 hypothetical protein Salmi_Mp056 [Salvia miltiorrhiza]